MAKRVKLNRVSVGVDPYTLKLILRAASRSIMFMVEHDMMISGGQCVDTEDMVKALRIFKKAVADAK